MSERTTVRLPEELLRRAKRKAAEEGRTLTALIEDGLRLVTGGKRRPGPAHNDPPVSAARGGVMPGVDLDDAASLQEAEDLEYFERMKRLNDPT